jgi:hypothetical protein
MVEEAEGSSPKISSLSQLCLVFKMKIMTHPQPIGSQLLTHLSLIIPGIPELLIPICPSDSVQTPIPSFQNSTVTTRKCLALPAPQQLSDCLVMTLNNQLITKRYYRRVFKVKKQNQRSNTDTSTQNGNLIFGNLAPEYES